jgi:hypothetical protein
LRPHAGQAYFVFSVEAIGSTAEVAVLNSASRLSMPRRSAIH